MADQVINIERKKYAAGLFWQPVPAGQNAHNYARDLARGLGSNLNFYVEYRHLVGMGSSKVGHRAGMGIAAAEAMEAFSEYTSFLAAFSVPQGYWVIVVRNGIIINDTLFETEADAKEFYKPLVEMPDWGILVAPNNWEIPNAVEKNLNEMASGATRVVLRVASRTRGRIVTFVLMLLVIGAIVYFFGDTFKEIFSPKTKAPQINQQAAEEYKRRIEEKIRVEEEKRLAELQERQIAERVVEFNMPYDHLPVLSDRAYACYKAIGFLMQPVPGWVQVYAECGEQYAIANVRRKYGTLGDFYSVGNAIFVGVGVSEKSESEITMSVKLPAVQTMGSLSELDAGSVASEVNSRFQSMNAYASVSISFDQVTAGDRYAELNSVNVRADSKLEPLEFIRIFDGIEGVSLLRVAWDAKKRQWNYEVKIYVK